MQHQDNDTGIITGAIPAEPPTCECCGDQFAEMIDIRKLDDSGPQWFCRDIWPCVERQARREAEKNREPLSEATP